LLIWCLLGLTATFQEEENKTQRFLQHLHLSVMIRGKFGQVPMPLHFSLIEITMMVRDEAAALLMFMFLLFEVNYLFQLDAE